MVAELLSYKDYHLHSSCVCIRCY